MAYNSPASTPPVLKFPTDADKQRIHGYLYYDKLFEGDHFAAFSILGEQIFTDHYNRLKYIAVNLPAMITKIIADLLFSEPVKFMVPNDEAAEQFINKLAEVNNLHTQNYESALSNSRKGDAFYKLRIGQLNPDEPMTIIIEDINPAICYPTVNSNNIRQKPNEIILAWTFEVGDKCYQRREIHQIGFIYNEVWIYDKNKSEAVTKLEDEEMTAMTNQPPVVATKINRLMVVHVPNTKDGSSYWGYSDYRDLISLFFALNNRITKIDNILDKHSDPILAVPEGIIDEDGRIRKEAFGMIEMSSADSASSKPEYIVWDANLEAAFKELEKDLDYIFMTSEISPATVGMDKDGKPESGRALKLKLQRTLAKAKRKQVYYDQGLKEVMLVAQLLAIAHNISVAGLNAPAKPVEVQLEWSDGLINDTREAAEEMEIRLRSGTISKTNAIAQLEGITVREAEKRAKEIIEEEGLALPMETNQVTNGGQRSTAPRSADQKTS